MEEKKTERKLNVELYAKLKEKKNGEKKLDIMYDL